VYTQLPSCPHISATHVINAKKNTSYLNLFFF